MLQLGGEQEEKMKLNKGKEEREEIKDRGEMRTTLQTYTYLDVSGAGGATGCWRVPGLHCQNVAGHCLPV